MNTKITRLELAKCLMMYEHTGQVDKAGKPYYLHPLAVADGVDTEDCKIVALLHDTLEDTALQYETVQNLFGQEVADAVLAMTHSDGEDYFDYVRRVKENPIAREVKRSDLRHNMDLSRLKNVTESDLARVEKYKKALKILEG